MSESAMIAVVGAVLACIQGISVAWLTRTINLNACGSRKCLETLRASSLFHGHQDGQAG